MIVLRCLNILNSLTGAGIVVFSLYLYFTAEETIPLYIALAIIIAGPVEDVVTGWIKNSPGIPPGEKEYYIKLADYITSLIFLILLGLAVLNV